MLIKKIAKAKVSLATINNPTIYCVNVGLGTLGLSKYYVCNSNNKSSQNSVTSRLNYR